MTPLLLDIITLPAFAGLRFIDSCSGMPIIDGLRCSLIRRRDRRAIAIGIRTPAGIHHWPELAAPWRSDVASPPVPPESARAEVLVEDLLDRFVPVRLPWPPTPDDADGALCTLTLNSAPQRKVPSSAATLHALLATEFGVPAAWARVLATNAQAHVTVGMSDAKGRLTLHLPFPRPERKAVKSPPESPPAAPTLSTSITLRVFHDPAVGTEALAADAPWLPAWIAQPEVRALARIGAPGSFGPLRLEAGRPSVPVTEGLAPNCSELRLSPF